VGFEEVEEAKAEVNKLVAGVDGHFRRRKLKLMLIISGNVVAEAIEA
jgi:hypothetical protein